VVNKGHGKLMALPIPATAPNTNRDASGKDVVAAVVDTGTAYDGSCFDSGMLKM
jgi:hypothetical protein